jgi:hypothetical protein
MRVRVSFGSALVVLVCNIQALYCLYNESSKDAPVEHEVPLQAHPEADGEEAEIRPKPLS